MDGTDLDGYVLPLEHFVACQLFGEKPWKTKPMR